MLTTSITPDENGRNIVRKERRKELALEHKTKGIFGAGEFSITKDVTGSGRSAG